MSNPNPSQPNPSRPNPSRPNPSRPNPSRPNPTRPALARLAGAALAVATPGLLFLGCGEARPRIRVVGGPAASATPAAQPGPQSPQTPQTPSAAPVSTATGAAQPGSGTATTSSQSSTPAPTPTGVGGFSAPPPQPLPAPTTTITVGAGPVLARTARGDVFEHLRDWEAGDLRALDPLDARVAGDGLRDSRELLAVYTRRQQGSLFVRLDLLDLRFGAESGGLDLVVLLDWGPGGDDRLPLGLRERTTAPWDAALVVRDTRDFELLRPGAGGVAAVTSQTSPPLEVSFRADLDAIELGIPEAHLRALGWAGQPLDLQVLTVRDGDSRAADAALEDDLLDRTLDSVIHEGWTTDRRATVSLVAVGNRAALPGAFLADLVHSQATTTAEGFPTGLRRTLESHTAHGLPINLHLSGVLTNAIGWARTADPLQDGAQFLERVSEFWDGDVSNGEGAFLPGLYVDNMMPYFEGNPNARFITRAQEVYRERLGVAQPGPVFWTPERVIQGSTFADLTAAGFTHTVIDRTHLQSWFGQPVTDGKLHRVNGVDCFVIDPEVSVFSTSDGGPQDRLRELLAERLFDPDPHQAIVLVADWEEYAGHKGNPNVPDSYDRVLTWLSQRPWIEVTTLEDLAGRGWPAVDHGQQPALPVETYTWLRHANEESYDHWYYGHPLEESFAGLRPVVRSGRPFTRQLGDVTTPGTLLGDAWAAIQGAPAGSLRDLAEVAFASGLYRTAWHAEDQHDLTLLPSGAFLRPDTSFDRLSGFVFALSTHLGEAAIPAWAAGWAAAPPAGAGVERADVDLDGEQEWLLRDATTLLVCEADGGRITAGFVRDAQSGEGYQVLGDPMAFPERSAEAGWEDPTLQAPRNSAFKDVWLTGASRDYVNDGMVAAVSTTSAALRFTSSDGLLTKSYTLTGPGQVEVRYQVAPGQGTLYTRLGLNPDLGALAISGQRDLVETDDGRVYTLAKTHAGRTVSVAVDYGGGTHAARRNAQASDGTAASPRNAAFQHMLELSGDAPGFSLGLRFAAR